VFFDLFHLFVLPYFLYNLRAFSLFLRKAQGQAAPPKKSPNKSKLAVLFEALSVSNCVSARTLRDCANRIEFQRQMLSGCGCDNRRKVLTGDHDGLIGNAGGANCLYSFPA
jgi:hypothetical protein